MMSEPIRIGIIGCGGIANGVHIPQLNKIKECKITALCDIDPIALHATAEKCDVPPENRYSDYRTLIDSGIVDAVEICTPNYLHVPIAEYAVRAGKAVNIEKPLGMDYAETRHLEILLEEHPVPGMMCFSYRFFPAVRYAKKILGKRLIGDIVGVKVEYLKSSAFWEGRRLDWRFIKKYAGTGVLGDLGAHLIDMAMLLVGEIRSVCAAAGTVVKQRKKLDSEEYAPVETDDYCNFLAEMDGGIPASFVITRCALGNANTIRYDIFGTDGVISFDLNRPEMLGVCIGEVDKKSDGLHFVKVPDEFRVTQEQMFVDRLRGRECPLFPSVSDGVRAQKVLDALERAAETKCWVSV